MMIMRVITLVGCAAAGYLLGGIWGATGLLLLWAAVLLLFKQYGVDSARDPEQPEVAARPSALADIDAVNDTLEDIARDRGWDLDKRLAIARMACENPSVPVDNLEDLYERGLRSVPDDPAKDATNGGKDRDRGWKMLP